ncbi:MAG: rod shape-determining protein MreC [Proteobacteria bacterium]|nr:rod shape-determining protein MreC [Pseudomonadota bacterium]
MFERLYNLILFFKEYAILTGFLVLSFILMALNDNVQIKQLRTVATVGLGVLQNQVSFVPLYFRLAEENELLRRMNLQMADEVSRLREAKLQNLRLRQYLDVKEVSGYPVLASNVISKNLTMLRNTLTLDIGSADGVAETMPVVSPEGLVGMVIAVSDHYCVVNILLNTDFRVSGKDQRSRVDGIIASNGERVYLKDVAKSQDVLVGDAIITSSYSNMFPEGIRIGLVTSIEVSSGSLLKRIEVGPSVNFVNLEEVFVVLRTPDPERRTLETGHRR